MGALVYPVNEQEFEQLVFSRVRNAGTSLVLAVYHVTDELTKQALAERGPKLACSAGCSACCYQPVSVAGNEWDAIVRFLKRNNLLEWLKKQTRDACFNWVLYRKSKPERAADQIALARDYWGKPCVFLKTETGECTIYEVRPMVCRSYTSVHRCTLSDNSSVVRYRFPWEEWGDQLILREDSRSGKQQQGVTPLVHWVMTLVHRNMIR